MQTVLGIFHERNDADAALDDLHAKHFEAEQISVITKDHPDYHETDTDGAGENVASGAVSGIATGGALGGLAGLLIGLGAIAIPGIGGVLIGGPIAAALGLTGAAAATVSGAVTGALAGGMVGALVGLGLPESEAKEYEESIRQGAILVAVNAEDDDALVVEGILAHNGADNIRRLTMNDPRYARAFR